MSAGIENYLKFSGNTEADKFVKDNVDAGKTVFVRFIASAG